MTLRASIVSHGHGAQVLPLLALLVQSPQGWRRVLSRSTPPTSFGRSALATLDVPRMKVAWMCVYNLAAGLGAKPQPGLWASSSKGLRPFFVVMNPDITWSQDPRPAMLQAMRQQPGVG